MTSLEINRSESWDLAYAMVLATATALDSGCRRAASRYYRLALKCDPGNIVTGNPQRAQLALWVRQARQDY